MKTGLRRSGKLAGGLGLLLALVLIGTLGIPALAEEPPPIPQSHQFGGWVKICDTLADPGTVVTATIAGVAEDWTAIVDDNGNYGFSFESGGNGLFYVPPDDLATPLVKEGGVEDDPVQFWVLGRLAGEALFIPDGTTELNLQVTSVYLTVNVSGNGDVKVNDVAPGAYPAEYTFACATEVGLEAVPDAGWQFDGWSGDLGGDTNPTSINMDGDKSVTATFTEEGVTQYDLTMEEVGNGTTTPADGTYPEGDVPITATPDPGWDFDSWSTGDMTEIADPASASTTLTLDKDKTVTATFTEEGVTQYDLTMEEVGNGTTTPADGTYPEGDVPITATPDPGWEFDSWSTGDMTEIADPASASTTLTLDKDKTVTATFTKTVIQYDLIMEEVGNGTTTPADGTYPEGDVPITATPDPGWEFDSWSTGDMTEIADPGSASTTLTLDKDKTVTATFTQISYDLIMAVNGNGTVTPLSGTYPEGDVPITATPDPGWDFDSWSTGDMTEIADPASASTTLTLDKDKTVTATFTKKTVIQYDLTMEEVGNGTTTPADGTYPEGDVPITATPDPGWEFDSWSTGDMTEIADPASASTTLTLDKDKTVTATFTQISYELTMEEVGNGTTTPADGTYPEGDMTITASADSGWRFVGWSTDDMAEIADPASASTTLTLDKDKTVTATFTERIGFTTGLLADWNLLSTPILLGDDSNALEQIFDPESRANIGIYYSWDAVNEIWVQVFADYELLPLFAIYVKVNADASAIAEFIPSEVLSSPMSRDLERGLNLIGPAPAIEDSDFPATPLDEALISIAEAEGGLTGYTMVISPDHNQPPWTYPPREMKDLLPYKGYWVVLENDDTLFGFSWTPIP